jgi:phage recombination protein Bet
MNQNAISRPAGAVVEAKPAKVSILSKMAARFNVDPIAFNNSLKQVAFRQKDGVVSDEQMVALLIVADQYGLNPFTKEIYAYPDKNNGVVPIVGTDGWSRIINSNPAFKKIEYTYSEEMVQVDADAKPCYEWIECAIWRTDREAPVVVREYLDECYKPAYKNKDRGYSVPGPWQTHTKRMLRHKAKIQCAREAFGFGGIYEEDEGRRIVEAIDAEVVETVRPTKPTVKMPQKKMAAPAAAPVSECCPADELLAYAAGKGMTREDVVSILAAELSISNIDAITEDVLDPCKDAIDASAEAAS